MMRPHAPIHLGSERVRGFSLIELLLAAGMAAVLMTAAVAALSVFGTATSIARTEADTRLGLPNFQPHR